MQKNFKAERCPWEQEISGYILGETSSSSIEKHLEECFFCQEQLIEFQELVKNIRAMPEENLSRDLAPGLRKKIASTAKKQKVSSALMLNKRRILMMVVFFCVIFYFLFFEKKAQETLFLGPVSEKISFDEVIEKSLYWLAKNQEPDGSWSAERWGGKKGYTIGVTGLALLSLIKKNVEHEKNIKHAWDYLLEQQRRDGLFGPENSAFLYNHGIATTALLESYSIYPTETIKRSVDKALQYISSIQNPEGWWGDSSNISLSVWQVYALCRAYILGWKNAEKSIQRSLLWLASMAKRHDFWGNVDASIATGAFLFSLPEKRYSILEKDNKIKHTLQALLYQPNHKIEYYHYYFLTHAICNVFQNKSNDYIHFLQKKLLEKQVQAGVYRGTWEPAGISGNIGGRVYSTAMATLSLQNLHSSYFFKK